MISISKRELTAGEVAMRAEGVRQISDENHAKFADSGPFDLFGDEGRSQVSDQISLACDDMLRRRGVGIAERQAATNRRLETR